MLEMQSLVCGAYIQETKMKMKPETEIRNLKRELNRISKDRDLYMRDEKKALRERAAYLKISVEAKQEVEEWKKRFDLLLAMTLDKE